MMQMNAEGITSLQQSALSTGDYTVRFGRELSPEATK